MAIGQELKDFVSAFGAGYTLVQSPADKAKKAADTAYEQSETAKNNDPLNAQETQARIDQIRAQTANIGVPTPENPDAAAESAARTNLYNAQAGNIGAAGNAEAADATGFAQGAYGDGSTPAASAIPDPSAGAAPTASAPAAAAAPAAPAAPAPAAAPTGIPADASGYAAGAAPVTAATPAVAAVNAEATGQPVQSTADYFAARGERKGLDFTDLDPKFAPRAQSLIADAEAATGQKATVTSGYRTNAEQAKAYAAYQNGTGGLAAKPGQSYHEIGQAVDVAQGPVLDWMHAHAGDKNPDGTPKYGVEFLQGEAGKEDPVHLQMASAGVDTGAAAAAVKAGLTTAAKQAGIGAAGVPDPSNTGPATKYISGAGAAPASVVSSVQKVIADAYAKANPGSPPMPESELNLKTLSTTYQYYLSRGETTKANDAASSLMQYYRVASQRYGAVAQAAASAGNMDDAAKAAVKAYANIPDGKDLSITKTADGSGYQFQFTDLATGKTEQKGILSPQELGAAAMRVSPADFDNFILGAAGQTPKAATPPPPLSPTEAAQAQTDVKSAIGDAGIKATDFNDPKDLPVATSAATHIYMSDENRQNEVTPEDAVAAVQTLTAVNPNNPEDLGTGPQDPGGAPFKAVKAKDGKTYDVTFNNGLQLSVPTAQFDELKTIRDRDVKQARAKLDAAKGSADAVETSRRAAVAAQGSWAQGLVKGLGPQPIPPTAPLNETGLPTLVPNRSAPPGLPAPPPRSAIPTVETVPGNSLIPPVQTPLPATAQDRYRQRLQGQGIPAR